jgi:hypothetical protein
MAALRRDIHVPNESDGFVFTSALQRGRGLMPGEANWSAAVAACDLLPILVESEDPANVRVLVGGEPDAAERAEWIGRLTGALRIPDGQLALCGGAAFVIDGDDWTLAYARIVDVPPGDYRATVYCYASAPNGGLCLAETGDEEPFGSWFRRTRADQAMPVWLHNRCVNDPDMDPAGRAHWRRQKEKRGGQVIDFLLHLEPGGEMNPVRVGDHGFGEAGDCRKPAVFPMGLPAVDLDGLDSEEDIAPVDDPAQAVAKVRSLDRFALEAVVGGPVEVPLHRLVRAARLAWMCHPYTQPALQISFPKAAIDIEDIEGVVMRRAGQALHVEFDNNGQPAGAQDAMVTLGKQLRELPDGSVIRLETARSGSPQGDRPVLSDGRGFDATGVEGPLGLWRFQGSVAGGAWRIEETYPRLDARVLNEALSVAEALEAPRRFVARDEQEAQLIEERLTKHAPEFFHSNPLQRSGAELTVQRRDPGALWQVATRAFWLRYAGVIPLQDFDLQP